MTPSPLLLGLGAALALVYWLAYCWRDTESAARSATKTLSVLALAAVALVAGNGGLALALGLGAAGDFALSRRGDRWFLSGVGAFAAAHVAYGVLFWPLWSAEAQRWPATLAVGLLALVLAVVLWRRAGALRGPVLGYVAVIAVMAFLGLGLPEAMPHRLAVLGVLMFVASDALLGLERFGALPDRAAAVAPLLVWPLYWGAQLALLLGLL